MNRDELLALADRCEAAGCDMVCPFCGDTDYDLVGLSHHVTNGCDIVDRAIWAHDNAEIAAALRAKASQ